MNFNINIMMILLLTYHDIDDDVDKHGLNDVVIQHKFHDRYIILI